MAFPYTFASVTSATGAQLDANFNSAGNMGTFPCTVSGTNAIVMTPVAGITPSVGGLANYRRYSGVVAVTNTTTVTIQVASLAALNGYKDSPTGPIPLTGGELVAGNMFTATYDSALNSGAGGFHISYNTSLGGSTITGNLTANGGYFAATGGSLGATLTSTLLTGNSLTINALQANLTNATVSSLQIGGTLSTLTRLITALGTLTYSVTNANDVQDQSFALTGAQVRDSVSLGMGTAVPSGAGFTGFISAAGTVTVRMVNPSTVTLAAATITVRATSMGFA